MVIGSQEYSGWLYILFLAFLRTYNHRIDSLVVGSRFLAQKEPITFQNILSPYISTTYKRENLLPINCSREPITGFLILLVKIDSSFASY